MSKCVVAYCASERPCSAHDRNVRPWAKSRRTKRNAPSPAEQLEARRHALATLPHRCDKCGAQHRPAELELDHATPSAEAGPHLPGNLRLLCRRCHAAKTQDEAARGRARAARGRRL